MSRPFILICLLLGFTACTSALSPIPRPEPINKPETPQEAIDKLIAQTSSPGSSSAVKPVASQSSLPNKAPVNPYQGVVSRKALAQWLVDNTGGLPKLTHIEPWFQDMSGDDAKLAYVAAMSPWSPALFPLGRKPKFYPDAPVNREQFCMLASILAGKYSELNALPENTIQKMAPFTSAGAEPSSADAATFSDSLDYLQVSQEARPSVAWAYRELLLNRAFDISPSTLTEQGVHPGQSLRWEEIRPVLLYLLERSGKYKPKSTTVKE